MAHWHHSDVFVKETADYLVQFGDFFTYHEQYDYYGYWGKLRDLGYHGTFDDDAIYYGFLNA